jgi:uncharacterized protein involved in response to NO
MTPIPRFRSFEGPALFSYGFRPFFLFGAIYAGLAVLLWLAIFSGAATLETLLAPRDWHIHEMLYGYLPAVVTGFILTAVPNWTGRLPLQGSSLLMLVLLWAVGRLTVSVSIWTGWLLAAAIDCGFLLAVAVVTAREILAGRNWRNLKLLLPLGMLLAGNVTFHIEAHLKGLADYGFRLGIAGVIMLMMLIGGRIVPSFTRNWLARANPGRLPAQFGTFDAVSLTASAGALLAWIAAPGARLTGAALVAAGLLQTVRLARWAGHRTWRDRLVLILHLAYAFIPAGFILIGLSPLAGLPPSAGVHAWMAGAAGAMTLAVMSRASLGHTGRALLASPVTQGLYLLVLVGGLARIVVALWPEWGDELIYLAGLCWAAAFLGFAAAYWDPLTRPRLKQARGQAR